MENQTSLELFREYLVKEGYDLDVTPSRIPYKYIRGSKGVLPLPYKLFAVKEVNTDEGVVERRCYLFDTKYVFVLVNKDKLAKGIKPTKI